ncbi:MAG TPA: M14 family zinc carboxypeptidase [Solirubrobacteraceae bacterium]|nr:M14 family zinc carboxypeptidase [Solirubrobacteraceae bacterium]
MGANTIPRLGGALLGALVLSSPAHAADSTLTARADKARSCLAKLTAPDAAGVVQRRATAPRLAWFQARLKARTGDWDLAVFDRRSGRLLGGSAGFGAIEVAGVKARPGQRLVVQACRRDSSASRARLTTSFEGLVRSRERLRMARVSAPLGDEARRMQELGIDLTEHGGPGFVDVLLHGDDDERLLRAAGFDFKIIVHDVNAAARAALRAGRSGNYGSRTALPSGRTAADGYRVRGEYEADMKRLVEENPGLVRPITLPEKTLNGTPVHAIEIASDVARKDDGRPVFVMTGVHHAREWPSSEHAIEWAFELVDGYRRGNADVRALVEKTRTIVVPIVNVDGFDLSRSLTHEMKRKNCRAATPELQATQACSARASNTGVDPNRNYSGLWGGVGASAAFTNETYRGADGFSEPETRNVQWLVSTRHVTGLITNHTYGRLVLRPPGVAAQGWAPDEHAMKHLGDSMASHNGYASQYGWQLYDTNGTTEDWSYNATGGYGYTFEIGVTGFHQSYQVHVLDEYLGTGTVPGAGKGGNRMAFFRMLETVADPAHHGVLSGRTQPNRVLELTKSFKTLSAPVIDGTGAVGAVREYDDRLESRLAVGKSRSFEWHVNPSTRPAVRGGRYPREGAKTTPDFALAPSAPTVPGSVGGVVSVNHPAAYQDFPFTVSSQHDNGYLVARIDWSNPVQNANAAQNWDLELYRKQADGTLVQLGKSINSNLVRPFEELQHTHVGAGDYVLRVRNVKAENPLGYSGSVRFFPPEPPEAYTLTCRDSEGTIVRVSEVVVGRGQRLDIGDPCKR